MSYGYSQRLVDAIQNDTSSKSLGVALGRFIIKNDIPVLNVSEALGVSRMTIYNWVTQETHPSRENGTRIIGWMRNYQKAHKKQKIKK